MLNSGGQILSHLATPVTILGPSLSLMTPTPGAYTAGQAVNIGWTAKGVPSGGATVSLYYTTTTDGRGQALIGSQTITANGMDLYQWDTSAVPAGAYYIAATLTADGTTVGPYYTSQLVTIRGTGSQGGGVQSTSGPTIGSVAVSLAKGFLSWNAIDAAGVAGGQVSIDGQTLAQSAIYGPYAAAAGVNFAGMFGTLSAGVHSYLITATDLLGNTSTQSGTIVVPAASASGPTISAVTFNLAGGLMTWNEADPAGVAVAQLSIDGQGLASSTVYGPFAAAAGDNFAGVFGSLAAGTHTYLITATDSAGHSSQTSGQFTVPDPIGGPNQTAVAESASVANQTAAHVAALGSLSDTLASQSKSEWGS